MTYFGRQFFDDPYYMTEDEEKVFELKDEVEKLEAALAEREAQIAELVTELKQFAYLPIGPQGYCSLPIDKMRRTARAVLAKHTKEPT